MRKNTYNWLVLVFTILGGLGGLACILEWLGIRPRDLRMSATLPHVFWLIFGLLLFGLSISLSILSWRTGRKTLAQSVPIHKEQESRYLDGVFSDLQVRALLVCKGINSVFAAEPMPIREDGVDADAVFLTKVHKRDDRIVNRYCLELREQTSSLCREMVLETKIADYYVAMAENPRRLGDIQTVHECLLHASVAPKESM